MKKLISITILLAIIHFGYGQIIPSSCTAPDSIVKKYNTDADRLALRKIHQNNLNYVDSVDIPQIHADTILNALLAVYNATTLPARDTVVEIYEIHSFRDPDINSILITADSNLSWMQQFRNGVTLTGNPTIDSLINLYHLHLIPSSYIPYSFASPFPTHKVIMESDSNYNFLALTNTFLSISGVYDFTINTWTGGGSEITATIHNDYVELIYSVNWGDCPSGCMYSRYWEFKIYYDCSVEFVGSYGNSLTTTINERNKKLPITISPNPFNNHLNIYELNGSFDYVIYNILGKQLAKGKLVENKIQGLDWLHSGQYLIHIKGNGKSTTQKLIKK